MFDVLFLDNYPGARASKDNATSTEGSSRGLNCTFQIVLIIRKLDVERWSLVPFNVYGDARINKGLVQAPDPSTEKEAGRSWLPFEVNRLENAARIGDGEFEKCGVNVNPMYLELIGTRLKEIGRVSCIFGVRDSLIVARQEFACCLQG